MKGEIDVLRIFIKVFISYHIIKKVEKWVELEESQGWWNLKSEIEVAEEEENGGKQWRTWRWWSWRDLARAIRRDAAHNFELRIVVLEALLLCSAFALGAPLSSHAPRVFNGGGVFQMWKRKECEIRGWSRVDPSW